MENIVKVSKNKISLVVIVILTVSFFFTRIKLTLLLLQKIKTRIFEKLVSMVTHFWLNYHIKNEKRSKAFYLE